MKSKQPEKPLEIEFSADPIVTPELVASVYLTVDATLKLTICAEGRAESPGILLRILNEARDAVLKEYKL